MYAKSSRPLIAIEIVLFVQLCVLQCRPARSFSFGRNKMIRGENKSSSSSLPPNDLSSSAKTRFITNKMCPFGKWVSEWVSISAIWMFVFCAHIMTWWCVVMWHDVWTAQKAWIALETAGVPFEMQEISLYGSGGKPDWFWKLNPKGTIPVLVCSDDAVFCDSDDILDNMEVVSAPSASLFLVLPENTAKIKEFRWALNQFLPIGKSAVLGGSQGEMWKSLNELDAMIQGPYVTGESISIADCAAFPFLWRIRSEYGSNAMIEKGCRNIAAWLEHCEQLEPFQKTIQSNWWWWW